MANLTNNLLNWYSKNKRKLPWRTKKNVTNPYYVWISEIMLQQTNEVLLLIITKNLFLIGQLFILYLKQN